jgi:hypothetical protein
VLLSLDFLRDCDLDLSGLFGRGRCPKGRNCNFLHVFKNPRNEFWEYDKPQRKFVENSTNNNYACRYKDGTGKI